MVWYMVNRALSSTASLPSQTGSSWDIEAIADYNQDGRFDLAWRNYSTGANMIWLMNGATRSSTVNLPSDGTLSRMMAGPR